ncbi:integrase [Citrobacter telavivensis]
MHRIDTATAQKDKFGSGKNGFTRGNPQTGTPATDLDDYYFDMIQEELCRVVEESGEELDKGKHDQLLTALRALLLSRSNPFGDIASDGPEAIATALANLGLGAGVPAIGIPFFWPSAAMPNTVMSEWSNMVFLKFNGATFSATEYPKLALVIPSLTLTEARGEFLRIWDDGRGVDAGRTLLSAQTATGIPWYSGRSSADQSLYVQPTDADGTAAGLSGWGRYGGNSLPNVGSGQSVSLVRPRNIAFNFLVRAK